MASKRNRWEEGAASNPSLSEEQKTQEAYLLSSLVEHFV
jgi:hypothetical protein